MPENGLDFFKKGPTGLAKAGGVGYPGTRKLRRYIFARKVKFIGG